MAFYRRRKYGRKRLRFKRRYGRRTKRSGRRFTKRVRYAVNKFAEKKCIDGTYSGAVTNSGVIIPINATIATGSQSNQKVGDQVYNRSLKLRLILGTGNSITATEVCRFRVIVGCWHDYQFTTPSITTIMENPTSESMSFYKRKPLQARRWTPMYDKVITLQSALSDRGLCEIFKTLNFSGKRLPKKRASYNDSNIVQDLYFIMIWNSWVGTPPTPYYYLDTRMTYTDV